MKYNIMLWRTLIIITIIMKIYVPIYLFVFLLKQVNRTGSPQGFLQVQIYHKLNTIQNMHMT